MRRLSLAWCAAGAALLVVGCGGDSGSGEARPQEPGSSKQPSPSRAEFIAQADSACRDVQSKQNDLRREARGKQTTQLVPTLRKQAQLANGLAAKLRSLGTPSGDSARVAAFVDSVRQIGVYSKALSDSIEAKHTGPARKLAGRLVRWRQVEHTLGQSYGFKVCARGSSY